MKINFTYCLFFISFWLLPFIVIAQTKGMIYEAATGSGTKILDPNLDGYTSKTTAGFLTDDQVESEIPFASLRGVLRTHRQQDTFALSSRGRRRPSA
jgi:hypothetical protein